ncbi:MAG: MMPL family transporter [Methylococcaceae bacterium]|nr:MMPL family transporter [Methylococcaceae bacterium]
MTHSSKIKSLFLLILSALVILAVTTTHFKTDISAFFIAGDNSEEILLASEIQSGTLSRRTILSIGSVEKKHPSQGFIKQLTQSLKAIPGVTDVWKADETRDMVKALETLYLPYAAQLYSRSPEADLNALLNPQGLADRAVGLKQALLSPQAVIVKKVAAQDPLLLALNGFKSQFAAFQATQKTLQPYENLILESAHSGMDVPEQTRIQQEIQRIFAEQSKAASADGLRYQLDMTGVPIFAAATQNMIQADVQFISTFSTVVLAVLFFWIFRSLSVFFWVSCLLVAVLSISVLVTDLLFGSIHGIAMAIGGTLAGICVDYPLHALVHAQAVESEHRAKAIISLWPGMLLGGVTTLIGYLALSFSGYPGFQQVAVFAATGILVALLLTRYVLPHLITGITKTYDQQHFTLIWIKFCTRFRPALLTIVLILAGISAYTLSELHWLQDLQQLTPELDYLKVKDAEIRSRMLSIEPGRFVLVSAPDVEAALQKAEQVYQRLDQVKTQGGLGDYFGLYPWILSQQQQTQNAQLLTQKLTPPLQQQWQKALRVNGLSVEHLGQWQYPANQNLSLQQVLKSPIGHLLDNQIIIKPKQTLIIIWLTEHQPEAIQAALADLPHVQYFSQRDLLNKLSVSYQERSQLLLLLGLSAILLVLFIRYRSLWKALETLAPALLSMLILLGIWALSGMPLSFLHLVGFLMVIAICTDYGIFYQENPDGNIRLTYQSIFVSMLTNVGAFGCLNFVNTSTLKTLAVCVMYGLILGFLLCPIMIKHDWEQDRSLENTLKKRKS